jgi:peptidoglycan-N-acetylglucosamine deacetylase
MLPHRTPFFLPFFFPASLVWRVPVSSKIIFLTFDDGPVDGPTDFVLHQLRAANAQATFFCIGDNVRKYPMLVRTILDEGHQLANHTYNHFNGWKKRSEDYVENVRKCQQEIDAVTGINYPRLFRPPYGRITRAEIAALSEYNIIMWDVLTMDYDARLHPERCLRNSIRATRPGSIVVFHDSYKAEKNLMYALPRFLDHFANLGYSFASLPTTLT